MSFGNLFIDLPSIGTIEMDVSLNEEHVFPAQITRNPVENGSQYADNIIIEPITLSMTARVSDASMIPLVPTFGSKAIDAYTALIELQSSREIISVVTGINVYQNMFLEKITVPRQSADGNSLRFELVISELLIVGEDSVNNRDLITQDVQHTALPENDAGTVQKVAL